MNRLRLRFLLAPLLILIAGCALAPSPAFATEAVAPVVAPEVAADAVASRRRAVEEETASLENARAALAARRAEVTAQSAASDSRPVTGALLDESRLAVEAAQVELEGYRLDQLASEREKNALQAELQQLRRRLKALQAEPRGDVADYQESAKQLESVIRAKEELLALEGQRLANLASRQELARQVLELESRWAAAVEERFRIQQDISRREALEVLTQRIQKEQDALVVKAAQLRERLQTLSGEGAAERAERRLLESQIKEAEESSYLAQTELTLKRAEHALERLDDEVSQLEPGSEAMLSAMRELSSLGADLESTRTLTRRKLSVLRQQQEVISKRRSLGEASDRMALQEERLLKGLIERFETRYAALSAQTELIRQRHADLQKSYQESVRRGLKTRHVLPRDPAVWRTFLSDIGRFPQTAAAVVGNAFQALLAGVAQAGVNEWLGLAIIQVLWFGLWSLLGRFGREISLRSSAATAASFSAKAKLVAADLLCRHRIALLAVVALAVFSWVMGEGSLAETLVLSLGGLYLGAAILVRLAYWLLVSPLVLPEHRQERLYGNSAGIIVTGAALGAVLLFAHLGEFATALLDLLDRGFMLFLLLPAYLGFRLHPLLMELTQERQIGRHWTELVRMVSFGVPVSLLSASLLGVAGYINLAWAFSVYLTWFLVVLAGWLMLRALLRDQINRLKNYTNLYTSRGLMWAQVIDPLHKLTRLGLFVAALLLLFRIYGWGRQSEAVQLVTGWLNHPLFKLGASSIDLGRIIGALLILVALIWLGRWVRRFTYSWLYASVVDHGIRNSLSAFTQYALFLFGFIIALNTLGLDLTSLAIFAGALGVGLGFGLQNIANNFVSGIILLAERPLRTGDWVTVGSNEGEVSRIGIRSVTVTTWDNQDVIIPNSDIVSTSFTNWTYQDTIVRTVLNIGISYQDDPRRAAEVIEAAVRSHPAVLGHPHPQVWLNGFGDSSVDFWVQYFIDVRQERRLRVKSDVLFAIWDALKAEGISIPFPQREVHIKGLPESFVRDGRDLDSQVNEYPKSGSTPADPEQAPASVQGRSIVR